MSPPTDRTDVGRRLAMTAISSPARTTLIIPAGGLLIALLIMTFGLWTIPGLLVIVVGVLGLVRIEWGLYGLIFLLPFTAVEGRVSEEIVQNFKRVLVLAIGAAWLLHLVVQRRSIRFPPSMFLPILVLGSAAVLSVFRAPERGVAISSTGRLLAYILVYVVVTTDVLAEPGRLWTAVRILLVSATLTAAFGLYQLVAYFKGWPAFLSSFYQTEYLLPRVHSFMQEPLWLSNYLLVVFPVAFALYAWRERTWPKLSLIATTSTAVGIVIAASRLGWATLVIVLPLFLVLASGRLRPGLVGRVAVTLSLVLVPFLVLWESTFASGKEFLHYLGAFASFGSAEYGEGDLQGHLRNLSLVADALRTSPLIGIGTNNIGYRFYADLPIVGPQISTTHNTYLDVLIETGGAGLLAFLSILITALRSSWRGFQFFGLSRESALCFGICMGILAMGLHLTNWSGWREAHVWFVIGLAFAAQQALFSGTAIQATDELPPPELRPKILSSV
jgi:O-antigen ligase